MFVSYDDIRREFNLQAGDALAMRRELRKMQSELHPDRNSGHFASEEASVKYARIQQAIDFLDQAAEKASTAVVPLNLVTELIKSLHSAPRSQESPEYPTLARKVDSMSKHLRSSHIFPKVSASAISLALTTIWLFPSTIEDHPVLGKQMNVAEHPFLSAWILCLSFTAALWVLLTAREQRQQASAAKLKTEFYQNRLFEQFLSEQEEHSRGKLRFRKDDFVQWLLRGSDIGFNEADIRRSSDWLLQLFHRMHTPRILDAELAQSLADVVFSRVEEIGMISRTETRSVSAYFTLNEDA